MAAPSELMSYPTEALGLPKLLESQLMNRKVQPDPVLLCCCGPERASTGESPAGESQAKGSLLCRVSAWVSCSVKVTKLGWSGLQPHHHLPSAGSREMHSWNKWLEGRTWPTRELSFAFADGSRDKGKYPTITWQIPHNHAQVCGMGLHRRAQHLMQPKKGWHGHMVKLKHCSRRWRLNLQNARPRKILLRRQSQSNSGRFGDWNGNALTVLIT